MISTHMAVVATDNFTRIMLVDDLPQRSNDVGVKPAEQGFEVILRLSDAAGLAAQIERHRPDVVVIDLQTPGRELLVNLAVVRAHNPIPVVLFSQEYSPDYIADAVDAGVTSYLLGEIDTDKLKPVIDVAMAQFKSFQSLRQTLDNTRKKLQGLSVIDAAKRLLMDRQHVTEGQAHAALRKVSMDTNQTLPEAAKSVIELFNKPTVGYDNG